MTRNLLCFCLFWAMLGAAACGPVPKPKNAYESAPALLSDLKKLRQGITSFRITGRVDHFGETHRVQGKTFFFSILPKKLRIELVSPFGSPLTVLTVNDREFAMHDVREGKYYTGPAEPCNIARLVRISLPADDVIRILIGHTPLIEGTAEVAWDSDGYYRVEIREGSRTQRLRIDGDHATLPLLSSTLEDSDGLVFDIAYSRWKRVGKSLIPHEIRVKMPREKADLLIKYDVGGVELNVELPDDAWEQTPPPTVTPERVTCR
jgi:outer membrane lipoprotein-sorting protein